MSLFDSSAPGIPVLCDVPFPANVIGGPGIAVDRTDPTAWLVELDYPALDIDATPVPSESYVAVYDSSQQAYSQVRIDTLVDTATGLDTRTPIGDADYTAATTDRYIAVASPLTLNRNLSLPAAASVPGGREILIQDEVGTLNAAHHLVITPISGDNIDGAAARILATPYGGLRLRSNGINAWNCIVSTSVTSVSDSNYVCNSDDKVIAFTALTAARTVTLPAAAAYPPGQRLTVLDARAVCSSTNTITVLPGGSDLINGLNTSSALNAAYAFLGFVSDGVSRWTVVDMVGGSGGGGGSITSSQIIDASPLGRLLLTQTSAAQDRTSLGSGTTGDAMFLASSPAAGRTILGSGAFGDTLFQEPSAAQARTDLGLGSMATQNANAVNITGGTITGIPGLGGSGASITISDTAPGSPTAGSLWFDSAGGNLYVWYNDGTSSQWVPTTNPSGYLATTGGTVTGLLAVSGAGSGLTLNPATPGHIDNTIIGATTPAAATVTSMNGGQLAGFRNLLINGDGRINQRYASGTFVTASGAYFTDRWLLGASTAHLQCAGNAGSGVQMGTLAAQNVSAPYTPAAGDAFWIGQKIEGTNISDLGWGAVGAKPLVLSFQVYASVAGIYSGAVFNSGSPSYTSFGFTFNVPVANAWTQISNIVIPGPTSGTWNSDNTVGLCVSFDCGSGSTYTGAAGSWVNSLQLSVTGAQKLVSLANGSSLYFSNVQLERGTVSTPFERRSNAIEMQLCRYYYQGLFTIGGGVGAFYMAAYASTGGGAIGMPTAFPPMRAPPSGAFIGSFANSNIGSANVYTGINGMCSFEFSPSAAPGWCNYSNQAGGGIYINAEL